MEPLGLFASLQDTDVEEHLVRFCLPAPQKYVKHDSLLGYITYNIENIIHVKIIIVIIMITRRVVTTIIILSIKI